MELTPLTYKEAQIIEADFKYLTGSLLPGTSYPITYITIGPFDEQKRSEFIRWHHINEGLTDYHYENQEQQYEVLAIAWIGDSGNSINRTIRAIIEETGIDYSFDS